MKLATTDSLFRNLPCSTSNLLMVEADRISMASSIFGISRAKALDILSVLWHRIEYTIGLIHKIKFYIVYGNFFSYWFIS